MPSIHDAIYTKLTSHSGVSGIVGTRVYRRKIPQESTFPLITYFRVSKVKPHAMGTDPGVVTARFQIDSWAETSHADCEALAAQVRLALGRWSSTVDAVDVQDSLEEGEQDQFADEAKLGGLYHIPLDFMISYRGE